MNVVTPLLAFASSGGPVLGLLVDATVKATVLLALAAALATLPRRAPAAVRHRIWFLALVGALVLPMLSAVLPQWRLHVLPEGLGSGLASPASVSTSRNLAPGNPAVGPQPAAPRSNDLAKGAPNGTGSRYSETAAPRAAEQRPATAAGPPAGNWLGARLVLVLWLAGALATLSPLVLGIVCNAMRVCEARPVVAPGWTQLLEQLAAEMGVRRRVALVCADRPWLPVTWGVLRPVILLPRDAVGWSPGRRRAVLLHELAHVKRCDVLFQMLGRLACSFYWFHPLAWTGLRAMRAERERACDDCVLQAGERPSNYASVLLQLARCYRTCPLLLSAGLVLANRSGLGARVRAILDPQRRRGGPGTVQHGLLLMAASAVVGLLAVLQPRPEATRATEFGPASTAAAARQTPQTRAHVERGEAPLDEALPPGVLRVFGSRRYRTWNAESLALSADGAMIATGGQGFVQIMEQRTGRAVKVLEIGDRDAVTALAFTPDGRSIAVGISSFTSDGRPLVYGTAGAPARVELWDLATETSTWQIEADSRRVTSILFTQDGSHLIAGGADGNIGVWDAATAKRLRQWQAHPTVEAETLEAAPNERRQRLENGVRLALAPDETLLVSGGVDGQVRIWDPSTGGLRNAWDAHALNDPHRKRFTDVAVSPDGSMLATCGSDNTVKLWKFPSGELLRTIDDGQQDRIQRPEFLTFRPDGHDLIVAHNDYQDLPDGTHAARHVIELRDARTGLLQSETEGHSSEIIGVRCAPDGDTVVSLTRDSLKVWDLRTLQQRSAAAHKGPVSVVSFSPDGRQLATAGWWDRSVCLWDVQHGERVHRMQVAEGIQTAQGTWQLRFSSDGKWLALAAGDDIYLWDRASGREVMRLPGGPYVSLAFGTDPDLVALVWYTLHGGTVTVYDISKTRRLWESALGRSPGVGIIDTPGGAVIVKDGETLKAFDFTTGKVRWEQSGSYGRLVANRDASVVAAGSQGKLDFFEGETGKRLGTLELPPNSPSFVIALSPDGRLVAVDPDYRGKITLWERAANRQLHAWSVGYGNSPLRDLVFSPDGRYLATANFNGTSYLLDVPAEYRRTP